jgi:hypothetical protein
MSWSGTVTCSYCYCTGHNSRKCPTKVKRIKERYELYAERVADAPDGPTKDIWIASAQKHREEYIKHTKIDLATGKTVTNKAAKALRMKKVRCSYCATRGHTRRTCQNLKNDYTIFKARTDVARQRWYEKLVEAQVGIGSLLLKAEAGYNDDGEWTTAAVANVLIGYSPASVHAHCSDLGSLVTMRAGVLAARVTKWQARRASVRVLLPSTDLRPPSALRELRTRGVRRGIVALPAGAVPALEDIPGMDEYPSLTAIFPTGEERSCRYSERDFPAEQLAGNPALDALPPNVYAT